MNALTSELEKNIKAYESIKADLMFKNLGVRRHGFLDRPQLELSEYLAHLFVDVKRPACGIASAVR